MSGFILLDKAGEFVAWAAFAEVALYRFRTVHDSAVCVIRASDGALITSRSLRYSVPKPAEVREVRVKIVRERVARQPRPISARLVRSPRVPRAPRVPKVRAPRGANGRPRLDLTGMRFGRFVAVRDAGDDIGGGNRRWVCVCDCSVEKVVSAKSLRAGLTKSCGCLKRELAAAMGRAKRKVAA